MTLLNALSRAAGLGLCVVALSGTALADPGNANPPATPPGQEKKAETPAPTPAPQAAAGQEKKAENQAKQAAKKAAPKPAAKSTAAKAATPSKGQSANAHHHVIICHRTGSLSNPYVVINIPYTAWMHAHSDTTGSHPKRNGNRDKMLKDPASRPGSKDGFTKAACGAVVTHPATQVTPTQNQSTATTDCPSTTRTVTETVPGYVLHKTGSKTNPYVTIRPSRKSAHHDKTKHPDDVIMPAQTVTRTISEAGSCAQSSNTAITTTTTVQLQALTTTTLSGLNVVVPAQTATVGQSLAQKPVLEAGGVAGAVSPTLGKNAKSKPAGGVLGAIASAPEAVADTAISGTLPFTGIPLWIAALIGSALLAAGLVLRRTA